MGLLCLGFFLLPTLGHGETPTGVPHPRVVAVFWGPNVDPTTQSRIGGFYQALTSDSYLHWFDRMDPSVGGGSYAGSVTLHPSQTTGTIDDTAIQAYLQQEMSQGVLPPPDDKTVYMIYLPKGLSVTVQGNQVPQQLVGYHMTFQDGTHLIHYAVMPDLHGVPNGIGGTAFDQVTEVSSHEFDETVAGEEIADPCVFKAPGAQWHSVLENIFGGYAVTQMSTSGKITDCSGPQDLPPGPNDPSMAWLSRLPPGLRSVAERDAVQAWDTSRYGWNGGLNSSTTGSQTGTGSQDGGGQDR